MWIWKGRLHGRWRYLVVLNVVVMDGRRAQSWRWRRNPWDCHVWHHWRASSHWHGWPPRWRATSTRHIFPTKLWRSPLIHSPHAHRWWTTSWHEILRRRRTSPRWWSSSHHRSRWRSSSLVKRGSMPSSSKPPGWCDSPPHIIMDGSTSTWSTSGREPWIGRSHSRRSIEINGEASLHGRSLLKGPVKRLNKNRSPTINNHVHELALDVLCWLFGGCQVRSRGTARTCSTRSYQYRCVR